MFSRIALASSVVIGKPFFVISSATLALPLPYITPKPILFALGLNALTAALNSGVSILLPSFSNSFFIQIVATAVWKSASRPLN